MKLILRLVRTAIRSAGVLAEILSLLRERNVLSSKVVWLDSTEVAKRLNVTERTLYTYKNQGLLKPHRIGKRDYYIESEVFPLR
ncbi:helix-turn-helix protein [Arcticibacter tournemirensis]|uniref:DNA-binding protein n=1 Tax=Arcticibacter tournemirensis TaxID=699437 RepID=A0A4Q0M499_9SPHI|nr:helix-turn-helix domain-containing protein [Arcticibacter tournemirensis]KAA8482414.1 helix-turn-helix domain-containing protein [Arcticibacter tournemirensis]RXF67714.1 DNA-binding protein [Arcticibacter tournemirensis]TQM51701.1 helix-turn-helix protein [Arcticibacter tournemirensis]